MFPRYFLTTRASDNCMPIADSSRRELTSVEATRKYISGHSWRNPLPSESLRKASSRLRVVDFGRLDIFPMYSMLRASVSLWEVSRVITLPQCSKEEMSKLANSMKTISMCC